jgi:hypothetical protein
LVPKRLKVRKRTGYKQFLAKDGLLFYVFTVRR